ncbi:flagellar filament capping protein FliD [Cupriavidus sp. DL-D2]|uniref:flagellar filament capping protein FliD n=1 Tax=Cupriavidus sp. DL-D2 TaxID=3144974 RepID=UPI0032149A8D
MAISSIGVGSNLELGDLLDKIEANEKTQLTAIDNQAKSFQAKLSGYGTIKSVLDAYSAAAKTLATASTFAAVKPYVTSESVLTAAANSTAVAGTYTVNVTSVAASQSLVSKGVADQKAAIGGGTITIDLGADMATGGAASSTKTVTLGSDTSLEGIRDAINKADAGVTASIVNDGSGTPYHIVLTSEKTGTKSQMRITASDAAVGDIVNFDPTQATQPNGVKEAVKAADAKLNLNGLDIVSQSNTVEEAAQGLTLTIKSTGTTNMSVTRDDTAITAAVNGFVTAYNNVLSAAKTLTAFDTEAGTKAALNGDNTLRNILASMRSMLNTSVPNGAGGSNTLSDLGIEFNVGTDNAGKLEVDDDKLKKVLANNFKDLTSFFTGSEGVTGMGKTITNYVDGLNATGGALDAVTTGLTDTLKGLEDKYTDTSDRIDVVMERYRKQFTALDVLVSQMNQTKTYLTQQFAAMNNTSNK